MINDINICKNETIFKPRLQTDVICIQHDWKVFIFDGDKHGKPGIAICTTCAFISGGWVDILENDINEKQCI